MRDSIPLLADHDVNRKLIIVAVEILYLLTAWSSNILWNYLIIYVDHLISWSARRKFSEWTQIFCLNMCIFCCEFKICRNLWAFQIFLCFVKAIFVFFSNSSSFFVAISLFWVVNFWGHFAFAESLTISAPCWSLYIQWMDSEEIFEL